MEKTMKFDDIILDTFLKNQGRLFDEPVAETREEADEFLEECMAQVFSSLAEVRNYWEEAGMDMEGMTDEELAEELEIFALPDGRFLVVEA
jgi:hypothetical protein